MKEELKLKHTIYVTSTDTFMSGWGKAEGKVNRCYVKCSSLAEAILVQWYLIHCRTDQKSVRLVQRIPKDTSAVRVSHVQGWLDTAKRTMLNHAVFEKQVKDLYTKNGFEWVGFGQFLEAVGVQL